MGIVTGSRTSRILGKSRNSNGNQRMGVTGKVKIHEREQKLWWQGVQESKKLRTYRLVKNELKLEGYLENKDKKGRREMARMRSGTNVLRIETGRQLVQKEKLEERRCWFGCDAVEDEKHFLLNCTMYDDIIKVTVEELGRSKYENQEIEILLGKGKKKEKRIG